MHISSIRIHNYKSFNQSPLLELKPGFNIIVGKNNAGKTALLEALGLQFLPKHHRSSKTIPKIGTPINPTSSVDIAFTLDGRELIEILQNFNTPANIPIPSYISIGNEKIDDNNRPEIKTYVDHVLAQPSITIKLQFQNGDGVVFTNFPTYETRDVHGGAGRRAFAQCYFKDGQTDFGEKILFASEHSEIGMRVISVLKPEIYFFRAERMRIARYAIGIDRTLKPNAENLAEVLQNLQPNTHRFNRFNDYVRQVLPEVKQVAARNISGTQVEVLVWNENPGQEREDLAVPLDECGTGVSQVLAILYVIVSSNTPQTIIIDEPQSFLRPGAVRKLIDILKLKGHSQHQYIIATHSPAVIAATEPATITTVTRTNGISDLTSIDPTETQHLRACLAEVGAHLSDLFGADDILWVEGQTEENCFPKIVEKVLQRRLLGTVIRGLQNTGDLEDKHAIAMFEIYKSLSHSNSLLPPALGFLLDDDGRTDQKKKEMQHRSGNSLYFTPRKMFENYLLHSKAITALINEVDIGRSQPILEETVLEWLSGRERDDMYSDPKRPGSEWISYADGAQVLCDLFGELTESRVNYDGNKVVYGLALTEWIIENDPDHLSDIAALIRVVLDRNQY